MLDLYAGSGAVGLEALSRGADHVLLVESDVRAAATISANAASTRLVGAEVRVDRVERLVARAAPGAPYGVVFLDPPYDLADDDLRAVITDLLAGGWLTDQALLIAERPSRGGEWRWPAGIEGDRSRRYGEATLWYGRAAPQPPGATEDGLSLPDPTSER